MRRKMGTVGEVSDDGSWRRWTGVFVGEEGRGGGGSAVGVRGGGKQEVCVGRKMAGDGERNVEGKMEMMAVRRSGGGGSGGGLRWRRRRRLEDGGISMTVEMNQWPGQGVAAVVTAAAAAQWRAVAAAAAVGLLPRPSLSSHLRGRSLISFFK